MKEQMTVSINDRLVRIHRGLLVKHALIACDQTLFAAAARGEIILEDDNGFQVGLEGALQDGSKIFTRIKSR